MGPGAALGAAGNPALGGERGNRRGVRASEDASQAAPTRILPANGRGRLSKVSRVEPRRARGRDGAGRLFRLQTPNGSLLTTPGPCGRGGGGGGRASPTAGACRRRSIGRPSRAGIGGGSGESSAFPR